MDSRFCSRSLAGKCISEVKPAGPGVAKNEGRRVYATLKVDRERNCSDESECKATHWRALEPLLSKIERHAQQIWGSLPDLKQHRATGPHGPACWHRLTYVDSTRDLGTSDWKFKTRAGRVCKHFKNWLAQHGVWHRSEGGLIVESF